MLSLIPIVVPSVFGLILTLWVVSLRRVVEPNWVHIVQSAKKTTSYGKGRQAGNVYYEWPAWLPKMGVVTTKLPVSVIELNLENYLAYDVEKVPFMVDVAAFFRIQDTNLAAERATDMRELEDQLRTVMEGAVRTVLASHEVDKIMIDRSTFGEQFTEEVELQLKDGWGVEAVKNMELMDIRDAGETRVISDIQEKRRSFIEKESRIEVAKNKKDAQMAEIDAQRDVDLQAQDAEQRVGERTAKQLMAVGIANEETQQQIKEQQRVTKEKDMAIIQVQEVKQAEINKEKMLVAASQDKETMIIKSQGELESDNLEAKGILSVGQAKADVEKAMQLAPVEAQVVLAKEIGENEGYQSYLIKIRQVEAEEKVGVEQAGALQKADVKVIANTGEVKQGVDNVMQLFSPKGGTALAGMAEAVLQSPEAAKIIEQFTNKPSGE